MSRKERETDHVLPLASKLFGRISLSLITMSLGYMLIMTIGCKGNGGIPNPYGPGEDTGLTAELNFGVETIVSRTAYDPSVNPDHRPDLPYRLLWVSGEDNIAVYSDKAVTTAPATSHLAVYTASPLEGSQVSLYASLLPAIFDYSWVDYPVYQLLEGKNSSLRWASDPNGGGIAEHEFFAAYPAEKVVAHPGLTSDGRTFEMEYPTSQTVKVSMMEGKRTCVSDMKWAYMMARKSVREVTERVLLSFFPVMTTLNISFTHSAATASLSDPPRITGMSLILPQRIETENLQFGFKSYPSDDPSLSYPLTASELCEISGYDDGIETIFSGFYDEDSESRFIPFSPGERMECMIFLPPLPGLEGEGVRVKLHMAGCHDLTLRLTGEGMSYSGTSDGRLLPFSRIEIRLPAVNPSTLRPNNWMRRLDPLTLLTDMSIPAISCRGITESGLSREEIKDHVADFFRAGIRVVDIRDLCQSFLSASGVGKEEFAGLIDGIAEYTASLTGDSQSESVIILARGCVGREGLFTRLKSGAVQSQRHVGWGTESFSVGNFSQTTLSDLVSADYITIIDEYTDQYSGSPGYSLLNLDCDIIGDISRFVAVTKFDPLRPVSPSGEVIRIVDASNSSDSGSDYRRLFDRIAAGTGSYMSTGILILPSPFGLPNSLEEIRSDLTLSIQGIIDCNYRFRKRRAK